MMVERNWADVFTRITDEGPHRPNEFVPIDPEDPYGPLRDTGQPASDAWCVRALVNRALRLERLTSLGAPEGILAAEALLVAKALSWLAPPGDDVFAIQRPLPEADGGRPWPGPDGDGQVELRIVKP